MKKYIFMAVAAIAALSSCSSDNDPIVRETGKQALTFTATMDDAETRATLVGMTPSWEVGDQISINGMTYNAQSAGLTTTFKAATPGQEAVGPTYNAYFACTYDGINATLPAAVSETWANGKFNMPMYATSDDTNLEFKNLCGVLKITVKNSQIDKVKKIKVSSATRAVSGAFSVTNNAAVLTNASNVANTLTITYTDPVETTAEGKVFYVAVPAQDYRRLKISLSADGNGFTKSMITKSDADITVARNKIYPITFADNAVPGTTGTAQATINSTLSEVKWVQLWAGGPKFADRNVGASKATDGGARKTFTAASAEPFFWGANWCLPNNNDIDELIKAASDGGSTKVTCEYGNVDGAWGFTFTGKETGYTTNSVFLPSKPEYSSSNAGKTSYWAGPALDDRRAWEMYLGRDIKNNYWGSRWINNYFHEPFYVRPVLSSSCDSDLPTGVAFIATMESDIDNSSEKCTPWKGGDLISINGKTYSAQYVGLTTTMNTVTPGQEAEGPTYNAYFACTYDGTTATLPAAVSETWADGKFNMPMYATSDDTNLEFKNLCGLLKITVKGDWINKVKKIRVSSANKAFSGEFTVTNNAAVLTNASNVANTLTVTYMKTVPTTAEGVVFYVAVPAQTYQQLKIELSADGNSFTKSMTIKEGVDIVVERNKIYPITFSPVLDTPGLSENTPFGF